MTAALPGAEVTGARALTADADGRFDSAVATLADGRELAIRIADDDETARELAAEALALRALTTGARAMLPFSAPEYIGETRVGEGRALVTGLLPGFQIEPAMVPAGRGAAESMGAAIAAVHGLPTSVVRSAGLVSKSAEESREELARLIDQAAATGRVPARLTVRWRQAVGDDDLWRFESTVVLGGVQATSFLFDDHPERGPHVTGLVGWHGLAVGDPALDLAWLSAAPDAAADVHAAYSSGLDRVPDAALEVRARLLAELEFARWLVHGDSMRRSDIVDDAAALLESLADGLRDDDLSVIAARRTGVDSAMDALDRVPVEAGPAIDTSMQTDAYNPDELWLDTNADADPDKTGPVEPLSSTARDIGSDDHTNAARRAEMLTIETEDLSGVSGLFAGTTGAAGVREDSHPLRSPAADASDAGDTPTDDEEAQRAARAALQRWKSSSSE
ncbi:phosphotransferase [Microbacterium sp. SSW1-49]|uniref:Phosphotransferase n=1 Tax=Microbacterium croceum TaxID=2851645 RepID=A0ABT0FEG0_9MICO|nr:phosphotransferase [Microbacterium croceum]